MSFENDILRLLLLENYMPSAKSESNSRSKVGSDVESLDSSVKFGDRTYEARKFGNKIWMINNLDCSIASIGGIPDDTSRTKNGIKYYTWNNAMEIARSFHGWHLPSVEEWKELSKYRIHIGLDLFKSQFNLFPTGYIDSDGMLFGASQFASFWTSSELEYKGMGVFFDLKDNAFAICKYSKRSIGRCVRLVKDD